MMRRWYMCSSKSISSRPRLKNGPITDVHATVEKSLFLLENTSWVASGPSAATALSAGVLL